MEKVKNTDTSEGPGHNVCEDGARRLGVHGREPGEYIVQLTQAVDDDEDVGYFELLGVPEYHPRCGVHQTSDNGQEKGVVGKPTAYADIAKGVVGHEVDLEFLSALSPYLKVILNWGPTNLIQFGALDWLLGIKLVQAVEPCELEQLLGKEEAANKVGHGTPER